MKEKRWYCWDEHEWKDIKPNCIDEGHSVSEYIVDEKGDMIEEVIYYNCSKEGEHTKNE